jgi:hypothetical protein
MLMISLSLNSSICIADIDGTIDIPNDNDLENIEVGNPDQNFNWDHFASAGSFDQRRVAAYSNGPMALLNGMYTQLYPGTDSVEKLRKTTMFSSGADLLEIDDISYLMGTNDQGNVITSGYKKSSILRNMPYPFAIIKEDLMTLSDVGENLGDLTSKTIVMIPSANIDGMDEMNQELIKAFGTTGGNVFIKTFKYDSDIKTLFNMGDLDLGTYMGKMSWDELFGIFNDPRLWNALEDARNSKNGEYEENNLRYYSDSSHGITCNWGYENGVVVPL